MENQKTPSLDLSKLQQGITRTEFMNKMEDFRRQMRELSESFYSERRSNEALFIRVGELEKEIGKLKRLVKEPKEKGE